MAPPENRRPNSAINRAGLQDSCDSENEQDSSMDSFQMKRTYSVPSTIDSPLLSSKRKILDEDRDSVSDTASEFELNEKCFNFH